MPPCISAPAGRSGVRWPSGSRLPAALQYAPPPLAPGWELSDLLAVLTTPIRSGIILTPRRLAAAGGQAQAAHRAGDRRLTLRAMLERAPAGTLGWLAAEALRWQRLHAARLPGDATQDWWAARAGHTARMLAAAAAKAAASTARAQPR